MLSTKLYCSIWRIRSRKLFPAQASMKPEEKSSCRQTMSQTLKLQAAEIGNSRSIEYRTYRVLDVEINLTIILGSDILF
ncbi:Hypothetical predicted protein [Octopus vulgaris]|uniref:Uncharacterized protein n=1 Tax=Octopus vulgaris TaxID=6645 RepID=A0AA36F6V7_OCTVU|nr:Hypothetical predicted protein [Octopus vulgaris]